MDSSKCMRNSYSRGPRVRECLTYFHADFGTFAFVKVFRVNFIACSCKIPRHHGIFAINVFFLIFSITQLIQPLGLVLIKIRKCIASRPTLRNLILNCLFLLVCADSLIQRVRECMLRRGAVRSWSSVTLSPLI